MEWEQIFIVYELRLIPSLLETTLGSEVWLRGSLGENISTEDSVVPTAIFIHLLINSTNIP